MSFTRYVQSQPQKARFMVDKRAYRDEEVLELERKYVFSRTWLYVGHESELRKPGEFVTRRISDYSILFNRDQEGVVRAFHNICMHRGTLLTAEKCGQAKVFTCPYHGWTYGANGRLLSQAAKTGYDASFNADGFYNLRQVPRLEQYRGFYFMNMNPKAVALEQYLSGAKEWIDLICDQTDAPLEVTPGEQEFHVNCNWKLITENQIDSYHGPYLHSSYFKYAMQRSGQTPQELAANYSGASFGLGNGHAGFEVGIKTGKPVADWIPAFGEESKPIIEATRAALDKKWGVERAARMCTRTRNLLIFPNTILNDVMSLSVRTAWPETAGTTRAHIWSLAPTNEHPLIRKIRFQNHLTFVGPGGFAHPDDYEVFDRIALGDRTSPAFMHDYSKGMTVGTDDDFRISTGDQADEGQQRAWWTQWDRIVRGIDTVEE
ncbi:MAG: aromatic ring-hydroxylating dioxygenase subunit alpha [Steroidobacteraceae bacterium]